MCDFVVSGLSADIPVVDELGNITESTTTIVLETLVQATQIPPLIREPVEGWGPHHVKFIQPGPYQHWADIPITFVEVISGIVYTVLKQWLLEKELKTVTLQLKGEYSPAGRIWTCEKCWLELEGVDLSVEEATWVKPSGTLHTNWISLS